MHEPLEAAVAVATVAEAVAVAAAVVEVAAAVGLEAVAAAEPELVVLGYAALELVEFGYDAVAAAAAVAVDDDAAVGDAVELGFALVAVAVPCDELQLLTYQQVGGSRACPFCGCPKTFGWYKLFHNAGIQT